MANSAIAELIESLDNDLPRSALFQKKVPALTKAFDAGRMKQILQDTLLSEDSHYSIINCTPGKALYLPDHIINMQYKLTILDKDAPVLPTPPELRRCLIAILFAMGQGQFHANNVKRTSLQQAMIFRNGDDVIGRAYDRG